MDRARTDTHDISDNSPLARLRARFAVPAARPTEAVGGTSVATPGQQTPADQLTSPAQQPSGSTVNPSTPTPVVTGVEVKPLKNDPAMLLTPPAAPDVSDEEGYEPDDSGAVEDEWPPRYSFPMNWQQEYRAERATLRQRLRHCRIGDVRRVLRELLAYPEPTSEMDWVQLGTRWQVAGSPTRLCPLLGLFGPLRLHHGRRAVYCPGHRSWPGFACGCS